jgi:protein SCO1/2
MTGRFVAALAAGLVALASGRPSVAAPAATTALKAGVFEPAQPAPGFALRGSDGAELSLARFKGRVVLLVFGFTNCPLVCPTTMATLAQAHRALGADGASVQVVYVTVDPERDDVARMKAWLAAFDPSFVGGTGTPGALAGVYRSYGVDAKKIPMPGGGYGMAHSSSVWLIDREGRLRALMPYGHDATDFVHDVRLLLAAK